MKQRLLNYLTALALVIAGTLIVRPVTAQQIGNAIANLRQLNGTAVDTNSGSKSAGTLRVVLATDQPQLTNKLLVTPDANSAVNVALVNGATPVGVAQLGTWTFSAKTTLTTTNFTSLANGSGWQSAAITTSGIRDVILRIQTKGQTSGTNYLDFYVCTSISSDSTYTDGCTGSEGTFTAANRLNSRYLCSIKGNAGTAVQGMCNLSDIYPVLPGKFAWIAINNTGAAMSTTAGDHVFDYETVK